MITTSPLVSRDVFEEGTGWELKPEGACRGEVCIPLPDPTGEEVDLRHLAEVMGLPLIEERDQGLWALGTEPHGQTSLPSTKAPDLILPDKEGDVFSLSSLTGQKVVVLAWAPY